MAITDPLIGRRLGDYKIQDLLGQGGMARVYRGYDDQLDRYAAVKVIEPHLVASTDDDDYRERFLREARSIARLSHDNIVRIYQFGQDADDEHIYYMAMSFVEGRDLREILKEHHSKSELMSHDQVLSVITDVASALDYAHKQGVIHRDIKPSNIMITPEGRAILTDFGLALNAQEGTLGNTFGSVHYIAPEQAVSSAQAVPQSDLYSLGVMLFEMLTGRVPFDDTSAMSVALSHISDAPPLPSSINPAISDDLEDALLRSLDKDPENRFESGSAMIEVFHKVLRDDEDTAKLEARPSIASVSINHSQQLSASSKTPRVNTGVAAEPQTEKKKSGSRVWIIAAIATLVIIAGLFLVGGAGGDDESETATPQAVANAATDEASSTSNETPEDINTEVPTDDPSEITVSGVAIDAETVDEPQVLLRYNGRSLVLYNRAPSGRINVSDLEFTQGSKTFFSSQWDTDELTALRRTNCLQVFTIRYQTIPITEIPADICRFRQAFFSTVDTFWISSNPDTTFEVKRGSEVLATCPTVPNESDEERRCLVELRTDD